jgi:hypothetical protein
MAHISGFKRDQLLLLHEAADDYVGSDNPVRFIVSGTATAHTKLRGAPEIVAALARNHIQNDSLVCRMAVRPVPRRLVLPMARHEPP